jgi:hypothetical protein
MIARAALLVCRCVALSAIVLITGCSHQPKRVDCDARLEPINPPTPIAGANNPHVKAGEP